tara:strand:+ start:147 stop:341 length:195 start_codon:yes stop_codon:yes gene_type:complete
METLNLADSIAELKVLKWQYDESSDLGPQESMDVRHDIIRKLFQAIEDIEVPKLIGTMDPREHS